MNRLIILFLVVFSCSFAYAENLEEIVVFEDSLAVGEKDAANYVEVVTSEKIERLNPSSTADLLKMISGLAVNGYDAKHINIDMGGYGAEKGGLNSVIMLNGRRISSPDMSGVDWSFIPVDNIDRVEVYQGGNSVLFGDRATGGAVNIVTKKPVESGVFLKADAGSYSTYHGNLSGQYASEKTALLLNADRYSTDGYRDNAELDTSSASGDFTYYHEKFELNAFLTYTDSDYGLPGSVTQAEMDAGGRETAGDPLDGGEDYEYIYGAGAKFFLPLGELNIKSDFRNRHRDYTYYGYGYYNTKDNLKSKSLNPFYTMSIDHKNYSNRLTAGLDFIQYDVDSRSESDFGASGFEIERRMAGAYISDRAVYKGMVFEAGYRFQKLDDKYTSENNDKDESENACNLLIGYEKDGFGSAYVRFDRSFRFPTTDELREYYGGLNTDIEPQISKTVEAGYTYRKGDYYAGVSAYKQSTSDEIFTNPTYTPFSNYNIDTKRTGGKIKAGYSSDSLYIEGTYTYVDAEIDEGAYAGNEIPLLSKSQAKASLGYRSACGGGIHYFLSYYSSAYAGNDLTNSMDKIDAYSVSDLKADYKFDRFSVYFKVNNLFNEKYYDYAYRTAYSEAYYPAAERNYAAGLTFRY